MQVRRSLLSRTSNGELGPVSNLSSYTNTHPTILPQSIQPPREGLWWEELGWERRRASQAPGKGLQSLPSPSKHGTNTGLRARRLKFVCQLSHLLCDLGPVLCLPWAFSFLLCREGEGRGLDQTSYTILSSSNTSTPDPG